MKESRGPMGILEVAQMTHVVVPNSIVEVVVVRGPLSSTLGRVVVVQVHNRQFMKEFNGKLSR